MSIEQKLKIITENTPKVYESGVAQGRSEEWSEFWDVLQQYGNRISYENTFAHGWADDIFKPKYDVRLEGHYGASGSFRQSSITDLASIFEKQGVVLDTSKATRLATTFQSSEITRIPVLNLASCTEINQAFSSGKITEVEIHNLQSGCTFSKSFVDAIRLTKLTLKDSTIGQNGFDVQRCTTLTKASIESIINALSTTTSGLTVTLSQTAVNNAFSTEEWTALANTKPNWTISLI